MTKFTFFCCRCWERISLSTSPPEGYLSGSNQKKLEQPKDSSRLSSQRVWSLPARTMPDEIDLRVRRVCFFHVIFLNFFLSSVPWQVFDDGRPHRRSNPWEGYRRCCRRRRRKERVKERARDVTVENHVREMIWKIFPNALIFFNSTFWKHLWPHKVFICKFIV